MSCKWRLFQFGTFNLLVVTSSSPKLDLVSLEVGLILDHFDKRLQFKRQEENTSERASSTSYTQEQALLNKIKPFIHRMDHSLPS